MHCQHDRMTCSIEHYVTLYIQGCGKKKYRAKRFQDQLISEKLLIN